MKNIQKSEIVKKSEDFESWYTEVILKSGLADYAPVKGCMVIRPYGYALWEAIHAFQDPKFKSHGVTNGYFPIFIPMSFLQREKDHVEGFSPELAIVTHGGGEELSEPLAVRPTSETIMYEMYKRWTQSYRDLPILINQWNNVVRWEKRTMLFLRSSEFLWQEGHCAHATHEESLETVRWALDVYKHTYEDLLSLSPIVGIKSASEKFAGADRTYTLELLMPSGKALQGCTSHDLGQNFARAFDWTVLDENGEKLHPWQNSWGFSTRSIGGLIMAQGDDHGLVLPPRIAPIQVVIIPVSHDVSVLSFAEDMRKSFLEVGIRTQVDTREGKSVGWKFHEWELRGVPVRIEIGKREIESGDLTVVRRDTNEEFNVQKSKIKEEMQKLLDLIQHDLLEKNRKYVVDNTHIVDEYAQFKDIMNSSKGFIRAFWCENPACEKKIKEETKATTRCLPLDAKEEKGTCIYCGSSSSHRWYFAQAY